MPRFSTVLFDLDGTLIDSIADLTAAGNHVCELHGWPTYEPQAFMRLVGDGQFNLVRRLIPQTQAEQLQADGALDAFVAELAGTYAAYYQEHKDDHTAPFPGMLEALDALAQAGVKLGVLTNKNHEPAQALVASYFGARFAAVQGRTPSVAIKPDPAGALALMRTLGAEAASTLMVGDSEPDIQVAQAAGIASCGVLWGYRSRTELIDAGATHLAATPAELQALVLGEGL